MLPWLNDNFYRGCCIYLNVLGEKVVAVRAVIKHHFIERGCSQLHHFTVVVTAVFVFTDHPLALCQLPHESFVALKDRKGELLLKSFSIKKKKREFNERQYTAVYCVVLNYKDSKDEGH